MSSHVNGAAYTPPERSNWDPLLDGALRGVTDPSRLLLVRSGGGPVVLGPYPVLDASGRPAARAAERFASGDLSKRVAAEKDDEVAQFGRRFNAMADRLSDTLSELAREKEVAEKGLLAKRELVGNVSRELRTPLASIRAHTESLMLEGDFNPLFVRSYLALIHRQSEQLNRLIDDLFVLSTSESGALPLTLLPIDMKDIVEEVVTSIPACGGRRTSRHHSG